jgi:hypothetical protein
MTSSVREAILKAYGVPTHPKLPHWQMVVSQHFRPSANSRDWDGWNHCPASLPSLSTTLKIIRMMVRRFGSTIRPQRRVHSVYNHDLPEGREPPKICFGDSQCEMSWTLAYPFLSTPPGSYIESPVAINIVGTPRVIILIIIIIITTSLLVFHLIKVF